MQVKQPNNAQCLAAEAADILEEQGALLQVIPLSFVQDGQH